MPPSQLQIATSALRRLVKEEASYHQEMKGQEQRIAKMESGGDEAEGEEGNREFSLRQERKALEETKAVFPSLLGRITHAREKLEGLLELNDNAEDEEVVKAKAVVEDAKKVEAKGI